MDVAREPQPSQTRPAEPPVPPAFVVVQPAGRQTVLWVIAILLAVIATVLLSRWDDAVFSKAAYAQLADPGGVAGGARAVYAFPGQVTARSYGVFMLDADTGTLWCYELQRKGTTDEPRLKLVAARSWVYDRHLEEFNTADPIPSEVRAMVQQQRSSRPPTTQPTGGAGRDTGAPSTMSQ